MQGLYFEDLSVGQSAETTKIVGAADVEAFAAVSGDTNPVHLDEDYARAKEWFEAILNDNESPRNIANRAQMLLDLIAASGKLSS